MAEHGDRMTPVYLAVGDSAPISRLGWVRGGDPHDLADLHRLAAARIESEHGPRRADPTPPEPPADEPPPEEDP